ncbi:hypothetical protein niasHS_013275 [Heterodera schachtii]|uniref:EGF-like domain-containing protein n=1 Tax=Heterodera schachtii TaxID=97005 RepID=A0ABD2IDD2_HETSC
MPMSWQHFLLIVFSVALSKVRPFPCGVCPKRILIEASVASSSCGVSEECDDPPKNAETIATTAAPLAEAKGNSSTEAGRDEEKGTERTAILAIAIRTMANGSNEERCSSSDCHSNGICFGTPSDPLCLCFKGFCGPLCKWAFCPGHNGCNGHGWCLATSDSAKCVCQTNFWGRHCEKSKKGEKKGD